MRRQYEDMYSLLLEETLYEVKMNSLLAFKSHIAEIKGLACPVENKNGTSKN